MAAHPLVAPALEQVDVDAELIEDAGYRLVDNVVQGLGPVVKGWNGGKDDSAHSGQRDHTFQMTQVKRRLAHHQDQLLSFLEYHIGGAHEKIPADGMRDA